MTPKNLQLPTGIDAEVAEFQARLRASSAHRTVEKREALLDRIHELMEEQSVSRADLARELGVTRGYITQLLGGDTKNFKFDTLVKLGEVFGQELHLEYRPRARQNAKQSANAPLAAPTALQPAAPMQNLAAQALGARLESTRAILETARQRGHARVLETSDSGNNVSASRAATPCATPCAVIQNAA